MTDVRQGPLSISNDPLATAAERCLVAQPMSEAEFAAFAILLDAPPSRPYCTAWPGYDGGGIPHYYFDDGIWRDTLTGKQWSPTP